MIQKALKILACVVAAALACGSAAAQTKLLRFPDVHGDEVVFCYAGDIWRAPAGGGLATRLTAHPGLEIFPKYSPDGKWIAFTGQYDGDEQVYVVPSTGGVPKQLTYYPAQGPLAPRWGYDHQVYGWTPDGKQVLFRALRDADGGRTETALYTVAVTGGLPVKLPMPTAGAGDFSPDGKRIVYSPLFRDFRSWKRYEGGWAQDLYIFDLKAHDAQRIAATTRTERDPMWVGDSIYFVSDRDGVLNLYSYPAKGGEAKQLTHEKTWDVRWASSDGKAQIVYELDGELVIFDTATGKTRPISISVPDDGLAARPSRYSAARNIENYELSPKGERALFVARGDIFTVPIEKGPTRNLTNSSNAHDRWATWSPDGKTIAFISDVSGEDQVYVIDQDGTGEPRQLTEGFVGMLWRPKWSPDGKRIAFTDYDGKIWVVTVETKEVIEVAEETRGLVFDYEWSPKGGYLSFALADESNLNSIYIWSVADGKLRRVTGPEFEDHGAVWDPEGKYLFFISAREFAPLISSVEWNYAGARNEGLFALALRKDVENPFAPESDEVTMDEEDGDDEEDAGAKGDDDEDDDEDGDDDAKEGEDDDEEEYLTIDFEGLADRLVRVPVDADNYGGLSAKKGHLIYVQQGLPFYGRSSYPEANVKIFSMEDREASTLIEGVGNYALSRDGEKILFSQGGSYKLIDAKPKAKDTKSVSTRGLQVDRVPAEEWATVFDEVWRRFRDYFYVRNMHGYDWKAIGDRYRQLVSHVRHRSDLNYVISEMIAELNVGHAYIQGGDFEIPERPSVGLPGARFELDRKSNRYRIARILQGENAEPRYRAPLTEVGVNVNVGDYVLAIDGEELVGSDNPYRLLQHKTDPVTLTVNSRPDMEGAREETYVPIDSERSLLYLAWVRGNLEKVDKATDGRVGYLHIPDMGSSGIYEFLKWFYPQIRKEGLVIDVRSNGGGNVSQWIIERLDTKLLGTRFGSGSVDPGTYPATVFHGHLVCLLNETSASDGDIFPYYFREAGLGPLIGKRSWGGVVGISGRGPLLDGGTVFVPLSGTNAATGEWVIEGHGVDPDIEVENDPKRVIAGEDPQLERGIEEVMRAIREKPMKLPDRPADPVKTK